MEDIFKMKPIHRKGKPAEKDLYVGLIQSDRLRYNRTQSDV